MKPISCYQTPDAANRAVSELQKHNLSVSTTSEDLPDGDSITVLCADDESLGNATELVRNGPIGDAITCPDCCSAHIVYPNQPEYSPTAAVVEKIAETLNLTDRTFFCHACQHEWAPAVK